MASKRTISGNCVQKSHFKFGGQYYDQIDGVSMGSPLGPLFANVFMDDYERKHFCGLQTRGVKTWHRFVDDTFVVLGNKENAKVVLDFLNDQHPNIKFTMEMQKRESIAFLDVLVKRRGLGLVSEIYRKPTFTGVYLNWTSLTSRRYKIGLVKCLLGRAWRICTDIETKNLEVKRIKAVLLRNNYPEHILDLEISKFVRIETIKDDAKRVNTDTAEVLQKEKDET